VLDDKLLIGETRSNGDYGRAQGIEVVFLSTSTLLANIEKKGKLYFWMQG